MTSLLDKEDYILIYSSTAYRTFQENYESVISAVKNNVGGLCDSLFAGGHITAEIRDFTRTVGITDMDKARRLIDAVCDQIGHDPDVFHSFVELLNTELYTKSIASRLQESYHKKLRESTLTKSVAFRKKYRKTQSESKSDSLHSYLSGFMDDKTTKEFKSKQVSDTEKIKAKFIDFWSQTKESFDKQQVSIKAIKDYIISLKAFTENSELNIKLIDSESDQQEIMAAQNLMEIFSALHALSYISFFNYQIIQLLILKFGSAEDNQRLKEYLGISEEFNGRNVFEVPQSAFSCQPQSTARTVLAYESKEQVVTLDDVQIFRDEAAQKFELQPFALRFCSVQISYNIEVHFLISVAVADCISKILSQHSTPSKIRFRVLSFNIFDHKHEQEKGYKMIEALSSHLCSHGLSDSVYWLAQLKELGVESKESLVHFEGDMNTTSKLRAKARDSHEKDAVMLLMKVKDTSNSLKKVLLLTSPQPEKKLLKQSSPLADNQPAHTLLETLGLQKYYPKKLQLKDARCIKLDPLKSLGKEKIPPTDYQQLPHLVLNKLMNYDSLCRTDLMPLATEEEDCQIVHFEGSESESKNDFESNPCDVISGIHPVDSLLALIICSDDFLRQDLFSRMAKCQLAVPFILPDPFTKKLTLPLWGLRSIIKEWDFMKEKNEHEKKAKTIVSYKMPIVTFIRLGKHHQSRSKSAILNEVINDLQHNSFFHRNCPGGDYKYVLVEGLVDMCWYLPGKKTDVYTPTFPDAITFLNLHGDAREHPEQMKFLSQISSMCFVLLTEEDLELDDVTAESLKRFGSSAGGFTLLSSIQRVPESLNLAKEIGYIKLNESINAVKIKNAIQNQIKKKLNKAMNLQSIEECCSTAKAAIHIDEHDELYTESLAHVNRVMNLITENQSNPSLKDSLFPLQGEEMWRLWAVLNKEMQQLNKKGNRSVNEYTDYIRNQKAAIRKKQLVHVESLSPVMESFITLLLSLGGPSRVSRNCFLQCLKLELNNLSRESISDMQYQYQSVQKEFQEAQKDTAMIKEMKLIKALEDIHKSIINSSVGLEHLLRELGQVYEAAAKSELYGDNLSRLPKAAAELLIDGYPLELMDGDAAHVPLQWVTAVLEETTEILNDPNVFVLSVLGLQSTGKSTLLNTVFGLQFNVSAGRCTHGAFMQLLPLDDELKIQTKCSYVLIVDTEGLRAPQLDPLKTQRHDNELATFVIGLANMTLINIYGEVPGDMNDILQTSVHAFIRMSQVKLSPSCQFIHQNAGTNISSEVGRVNFTKKLNQCTAEAAKQEKCEEKFKCFNNVIKFDYQTDVHYFPALWKGDPPMAPVNPGYSQSAQLLKLHLVNILCKIPSMETSSDLSLSGFQKKVQCLWKALLEENFVFSFKNTQEITAYNLLEIEHSKWDWEFRKAMLKWEQVAENELNVKEAKAVSELVKEKCKQLPEHMATLYQPIKANMEAFFSGKQSEILVQWKTKFQKKIDNLMEELRAHAEKHCKKIGQSREAISKIEGDRKSYAATITRRVQDHITSVRKARQELYENLKEGKMNSDQMETILSRKLFTNESLKQYQEQGLITEEQVSKVQEIIFKCGSNGQLTKAGLHDIMFGRIFRLHEIKQLLIVGWQTVTEEELETKFNCIWKDIIEQVIPFEFQEALSDCVESEVECTMVEFVRAQGYKNQLIAKLQEGKTLSEWGAKLCFTPEKGTHYTKKLLGKKVKSKEMAQKMTENVFKRAQKCLDQITKESTNFKTSFCQKLLHEVDTAITEESEAIKEQLTIKHEYRYTILLVVCGYAIPKFKEMATSFREQINPRSYMDKHVRNPLFEKYKKQYNQAKGEEVIAATLCAHLEEPIKEQINKSIGTLLVDEMKGSEHCFTSKMALKVKILTDLDKEGDFEHYMDYIIDFKQCLQNRIRQYTVQYADKRVPASGETKLCMLAKKEVSHLITVISQIIAEVNKTEIQEWLTTFTRHKKLVRELGNLNLENVLTGFDSLEEINLDNFQLQIHEGLKKLTKKLHTTFASIMYEKAVIQWKDKSHELLANLTGCTEQCPFCGEQCDFLDPNHYTDNDSLKHKVTVHRPMCLLGWRGKDSRVMRADFCSSMIASERCVFDQSTGKRYPFKEYYCIHPEWSIPQDYSSKSSLYWMRFVGKYAKELADEYGAEPADIPDGWQHIEWSEVASNLNSLYKT